MTKKSNLTPVAITLTILLIVGCSNRYGFVIQQTVIRVETTPKQLPFFIISPHLSKGLVPAQNFDLPFNQSAALERYLMTQISDRSNGSGFRHQTGRYMLIVRCTTLWRGQSIDIKPDQLEPFFVTCPANEFTY